jgi:hypothetical protein
MNEKSTSDRRHFLKLVGGASAALVLLGSLPRRAWAALPHLTQENSATAKALNYVEDNTKAPAPHKPGQDCSNCMHYKGKSGQTYGPCTLFPGYDVHKDGWCAGYAANAKS